MKEELNKIEEIIVNTDDIKISNVPELIEMFFKKLSNRIDSYIVELLWKVSFTIFTQYVKIGDDVFLGPNVYIGANSEIPDYAEISNTIIFDNVKIGENFKLENCIVAKNSSFNFKNMSMKNSLLIGATSSKDELQSKQF